MIDPTRKLLRRARMWAAALILMASAPLAFGQTIINYDGGCEDAPDFTTDWSCADNWNPDEVPNNGVDTYEVFIDGSDNPFLDIDATIDTFDGGGNLGDNAILTTDTNDLTVLGALTLDIGGQYVGSGASSSSALLAGSIDIIGGPNTPGGGMFLEGTMSAVTSGALSIGDPGDCTPPDLIADDDAVMSIEGDVNIFNKANINYTSSIPMCVAGNFNNLSTERSIYKFQSGKVRMPMTCAGPGPGPAPETAGPMGKIGQFEVAGTDFGPAPRGFIDNFALGELIVGQGKQIVLRDLFDNDEMGMEPCTEALYVNNLTIEPGGQLLVDNVRVYFATLDAEPTAIVPLGCGQAIPFQPAVPTASGFGLVILGGGLLAAASTILKRRRRQR